MTSKRTPPSRARPSIKDKIAKEKGTQKTKRTPKKKNVRKPRGVTFDKEERDVLRLGFQKLKERYDRKAAACGKGEEGLAIILRLEVRATDRRIDLVKPRAGEWKVTETDRAACRDALEIGAGMYDQTVKDLTALGETNAAAKYRAVIDRVRTNIRPKIDEDQDQRGLL